MKSKYHIILFFTITFMIHITSNLVHPVTPTFFKELAFNDYMFGVSFATMSFMVFLFSPFWGKLVTIISEKNVIFICCIGYSIGQICFMLSTTQTQIILARLIGGAFSSGIFVATLTYIAYISSIETKAKNITILATISTLGTTLGYFLGGIIGETSIKNSFLMQIVMLIVLGICSKVVIIKRAHLVKMDKSTLIKEANPFISFFSIAPYLTPLLSLLFFISFMASFATTSFDQTFNYYLIDELLFTPSYNGYIKAGVGIISLLANVFICFRIIRNNKILLGLMNIFFLCSVALFSAILTNNLTLFLIIVFIYFGCNSIYLPLLQNCCASFGNEQSSSIILAFYNATKGLGMILGALVAGFTYELNGKIPFILACISFFICCLCQLKYIRKLVVNEQIEVKRV
ncbi:hypothetical protein AN641_09865 [Candidatus Epulonipiscioides gigas]|nr:hypothetical protein AN641_09865 [Epulopiscium sp. SCG-C07WGA-EpuloA2]